LGSSIRNKNNWASNHLNTILGFTLIILHTYFTHQGIVLLQRINSKKVIIMFQNIKKTYNEFPQIFWMVTIISFIDMLGNYILMPYIALYVTSRFGVGLTQVGIVWAIVGVGNLIGGMFGGALTDKLGRKFMILFGLIVSASFSIVVIFVNKISTLYIVVLVMGLMGSIAGPARSAMVVDVLPVEKRTEGFGILRITMNLAATIGPALGGFISKYSFSYLFIMDAAASFIVGILFFFVLPETKPKLKTDEIKLPETSGKKDGGYREVFRDWKFLLFVLISAISVLVYEQMNTTLPVFLRDTYAFPNFMFGWLLSMNALMVVLFQYLITKLIKRFSAFKMIALGNVLYAVGFGMYGFFETVPMFFVAMIIITLGEMIVAPYSQTIAANFAPEDKRGRYLAVMQWTGLVPTLFGVLGAGIIMENHNPLIIWYLAFILCMVAASGYFMLHKIHRNPMEANQSNKDNQEVQNIQNPQIIAAD